MIIFKPNTRLINNMHVSFKANAIELMHTKTLEQIITELSDQLTRKRSAVQDIIRNIRKHDMPTGKAMYEQRLYLMPEGKIEDWRFNKSYFDRNTDKVITTEPLYDMLIAFGKTARKNINKEWALPLHTDLKTALANLEYVIGILSIVYPVYCMNTQPTEIAHKDYDPNKPITEQKVPGYIWRRFAARNMLPQNTSMKSLWSVVPNYMYTIKLAFKNYIFEKQEMAFGRR